MRTRGSWAALGRAEFATRAHSCRGRRSRRLRLERAAGEFVLARTTGAVAALIGVLVTAWGTVLVATSAEDEDRVRGVVGVVGLVAGIALLAVGVGGWRAARRERR